MKWLIMVVVFFGIPFYLLNNFVVPELEQMKNFYGNIDQVAQHAVETPRQ